MDTERNLGLLLGLHASYLAVSTPLSPVEIECASKRNCVFCKWVSRSLLTARWGLRCLTLVPLTYFVACSCPVSSLCEWCLSTPFPVPVRSLVFPWRPPYRQPCGCAGSWEMRRDSRPKS